MNKITIGLFGTCGGSNWRETFKHVYEKENISFYDPQVVDWKPEDAIIEAEHLANDEIILFPITGETYGMGSLAETGFSILQAVKLEEKRDFVILIEPKPYKELEDSNPVLFKESCRARALVIQHLKKLRLSNVYMVETLEEMLSISLVLNKVANERAKLNKYLLCK